MFKIIIGDSAKKLKDIKTGSIDLSIQSPPYTSPNKAMRSNSEYQAVFDFETIAHELYRVLKDGSFCLWIVNDVTFKGCKELVPERQLIYFKDDVGFTIHQQLIYAKPFPQYPGNTRYNENYEYIFVMTKGKLNKKQLHLIKDRPNKGAGKKITGIERKADGTLKEKYAVKQGKLIQPFSTRNAIQFYNIGLNNTCKDKDANKIQHGAMMPEQLAEDLIIAYSNKGDKVLSAFSGLGTEGKMAVKNNRDFIGIEISKEFAKYSRKRIRRNIPKGKH